MSRGGKVTGVLLWDARESEAEQEELEYRELYSFKILDEKIKAYWDQHSYQTFQFVVSFLSLLTSAERNVNVVIWMYPDMKLSIDTTTTFMILP